MTKWLYSWKLETNRLQIVFLFPVQTLHLCRPMFSCLLPGKVTSPRRDKNQWHHVSSGAQTLQEAGASVEWGLCCPTLGLLLKQPSGPNAGGHFHGFSSDLGRLWAPSSFSSCNCVVGPASFRPAGRARPGGICKNKSPVFYCPCENKRAFLERGPLLLLGKTFSVRGQQRRESWCGGPWLQPPEELGTGVPQLAPLLEIVTGHSAWNRTTELQSWLCIVSHSELQNLVCYVFSTQD